MGPTRREGDPRAAGSKLSLGSLRLVPSLLGPGIARQHFWPPIMITVPSVEGENLHHTEQLVNGSAY